MAGDGSGTGGVTGVLIERDLLTSEQVGEAELQAQRSGKKVGTMLVERIHALEQRIADLRARLPRHSPPTAMLVELDELEDELSRLREEDGRDTAT